MSEFCKKLNLRAFVLFVALMEARCAVFLLPYTLCFNIVADRVSGYLTSSGKLLAYSNEVDARNACVGAVKRVVLDMLLESEMHYRLFVHYMDNQDFKVQIEDYSFIKAYLLPMFATHEFDGIFPSSFDLCSDVFRYHALSDGDSNACY
jgi:hypothetical protein